MKNAETAEIILHRIQTEENMGADAVNLSTLEIHALKQAYSVLVKTCNPRPEFDFINS